MKKIKVNQIIVFTQKGGSGYFKEKSVVLKITRVDNFGDLWADNIKNKYLSDGWKDNPCICLGSLKNFPEEFREPTDKELKEVINAG